MHERNTAQQHTGHTNHTDPRNGTDGVPQVKLLTVVRRDTGCQRNEGTHNRHETAQNQGQAAAFTEELLRGVQVLRAQNLRVILEDVAAVAGTNLVSHLGAGHRHNHQHGECNPQGQTHLLVQHAQRKDQGVTRKNREQHTRLNENNDRRNNQNPGAGVEQELFKVKA